MSRPLGVIEQQPCGLGDSAGCVGSVVDESDWEWSSMDTNSKELEFLGSDRVFMLMLTYDVGRDRSFVNVETGR